ncbi:MAG TPA: YerC/YecD family TrpR-related protein [Candidatus Bathyarchaeia archaeon]|nr:YerC/YecD family TrpR-related protein [Candidatus Bathyarchaeia archaeon]
MQVSKKKINKKLEKKIGELFYQTIADIKNPQEVEVFLKDLLTETEISVVTKRLGTAYLLNKGKNYREIKDTLKISSATISVVADQIKKGRGFKIGLKKIEADEWADRWTRKIKKMLSIKA